MSKCCGCISVCAITEAYQPLKTHTHPRDIVQETFRNGREVLRSPRDRRRKPSVRYDVVRTPASGSRFRQNQKRSRVIGSRYSFLLDVVLLKPIAREHKRNVGPQTLARREVGAERLRSVAAHQFARKRGAGRMRVASCKRSVHVAANVVSSFPAPTPSALFVQRLARAAKEEIICTTSFRLERKVFRHQETCWPPFGRHEDGNFQSSSICRGSQCPHRRQYLAISFRLSYFSLSTMSRFFPRSVVCEQSHRHLPGTLRGSLNHSHNHHHNHPHRHELPPSTYLTPPPPPPASSYITVQRGCALHSRRDERKIYPADHVFPALGDYERVSDMRTNQPELLVYCTYTNGRYVASKSINLSPGCTSCSRSALFPPRDEAPFVISDFKFLTKIEDFGLSAITRRMLLPVRLNLGSSEEGTSWHRVSGAKVLRDNPTRCARISLYRCECIMLTTKEGELFDLTRNDPKGDVTVVISSFAITTQKMDRLRGLFVNFVNLDLHRRRERTGGEGGGSSGSTNVGGKGACQLGPRRATSRVTPEFSPLLAGIVGIQRGELETDGKTGQSNLRFRRSDKPIRYRRFQLFAKNESTIFEPASPFVIPDWTNPAIRMWDRGG
ncbi:hypothetical protein ALC56_14055 [Trachymyrmex septentrionalis]|uniref:Uncharacterized protein n=1 Tax=Trachymyrmex septentrionalis TaxID=34720 RepID=A0A151JTI2_9HYME|nr:hypothetical protein ALC56_14055 [Trachymyrmex septentrionalis]